MHYYQSSAVRSLHSLSTFFLVFSLSFSSSSHVCNFIPDNYIDLRQSLFHFPFPSSHTCWKSWMGVSTSTVPYGMNPHNSLFLNFDRFFLSLLLLLFFFTSCCCCSSASCCCGSCWLLLLSVDSFFLFLFLLLRLSLCFLFWL